MVGGALEEVREGRLAGWRGEKQELAVWPARLTVGQQAAYGAVGLSLFSGQKRRDSRNTNPPPPKKKKLQLHMKHY